MSRDFVPGDRVHVAGFGTGVVREARNGGRFLIELKGHAMVVAATELAAAEPSRAHKAKPLPEATSDERSGGRLKSAVHRRLKELASVHAFRIDPHNPGATIVTF